METWRLWENPRDSGGKSCSNAAASQGMQRKLATMRSKEETRKCSKGAWLQRELGSAHTLILDFILLDLGENIFLLY